MAARREHRSHVENVLPRYCGENVRNDFWCDLVDELMKGMTNPKTLGENELLKR
jgi:hypothetical protein